MDTVQWILDDQMPEAYRYPEGATLSVRHIGNREWQWMVHGEKVNAAGIETVVTKAMYMADETYRLHCRLDTQPDKNAMSDLKKATAKRNRFHQPAKRIHPTRL